MYLCAKISYVYGNIFMNSDDEKEMKRMALKA